jgi:hypothetical protein
MTVFQSQFTCNALVHEYFRAIFMRTSDCKKPSPAFWLTVTAARGAGGVSAESAGVLDQCRSRNGRSRRSIGQSKRMCLLPRRRAFRTPHFSYPQTAEEAVPFHDRDGNLLGPLRSRAATWYRPLGNSDFRRHPRHASLSSRCFQKLSRPDQHTTLFRRFGPDPASEIRDRRIAPIDWPW